MSKTKKLTDKFSVSMTQIWIAMILAILAMVMVLGIGAVYNSTVSMAATAETDIVEIRATTTQEPKPVSVVTSTPITHRIEVKNLGADCWIRAKVDWTLVNAPFDCTWHDMGENTALGGADIINGENWIYSDGYYYYTPILKRDGAAQFTETIPFPHFMEKDGKYVPAFDFDAKPGYETGSGAHLTSKITVEAIQADHFEVDFSDEHPWGDVTVEETIWTEVFGGE